MVGRFEGWFWGFCACCPCLSLAIGLSAPPLGDRLLVFGLECSHGFPWSGFEQPTECVYLLQKNNNAFSSRAGAYARASCCLFFNNHLIVFR